ncbi:MAG: hypothetical protein JSS82_14265 [Bacteroidetes bacterium]|nr:hypothetical protein [Bacteroidota bacterium]
MKSSLTYWVRVNETIGCASFIGSGYCNVTNNGYSTIVGGSGNCITGTGNSVSFIGGGSYNTISATHSGIVAGRGNCVASDFSGIVAGCANTITSSADCAFIGGGNANCITGAFSAVLGGCGNFDNGNAYAGLFGCNVIAVQACAMHSNNFVAQNIPAASTGTVPPIGAQPGSLYYVLVGGYKQVWIT